MRCKQCNVLFSWAARVIVSFWGGFQKQGFRWEAICIFSFVDDYDPECAPPTRPGNEQFSWLFRRLQRTDSRTVRNLKVAIRISRTGTGRLLVYSVPVPVTCRFPDDR